VANVAPLIQSKLMAYLVLTFSFSRSTLFPEFEYIPIGIAGIGSLGDSLEINGRAVKGHAGFF